MVYSQTHLFSALNKDILLIVLYAVLIYISVSGNALNPNETSPIDTLGKYKL